MYGDLSLPIYIINKKQLIIIAFYITLHLNCCDDWDVESLAMVFVACRIVDLSSYESLKLEDAMVL